MSIRSDEDAGDHSLRAIAEQRKSRPGSIDKARAATYMRVACKFREISLQIFTAVTDVVCCEARSASSLHNAHTACVRCSDVGLNVRAFLEIEG
jgi:hypothetical protein